MPTEIHNRPADIYPRTTDFLRRGAKVNITLNQPNPVLDDGLTMHEVKLLSVDAFGAAVQWNTEPATFFPWSAIQSVEVAR